jgi:hypothetical protein
MPGNKNFGMKINLEQRSTYHKPKAVGHYSRDKGNRVERAIVRLLQAQGFAAEKISGMYRAGADISVPLLGIDRDVEVKCRAHGFGQLYDWLNNRYALIVRADRREPLVVLRLEDAAAIAALAEKSRGRP